LSPCVTAGRQLKKIHIVSSDPEATTWVECVGVRNGLRVANNTDAADYGAQQAM
jgi:hypothetical protein